MNAEEVLSLLTKLSTCSHPNGVRIPTVLESTHPPTAWCGTCGAILMGGAWYRPSIVEWLQGFQEVGVEDCDPSKLKVLLVRSQ
jgi:hypothetical protein